MKHLSNKRMALPMRAKKAKSPKAKPIAIGVKNYQAKIQELLSNPDASFSLAQPLKKSPSHIHQVLTYLSTIITQIKSQPNTDASAAQVKKLQAIQESLVKSCLVIKMENACSQQANQLLHLILEIVKNNTTIANCAEEHAYHMALNLTAFGIRLLTELCKQLITEDPELTMLANQCATTSRTCDTLSKLEPTKQHHLNEWLKTRENLAKAILTIELCVILPLETETEFIDKPTQIKLTNLALMLMEGLPDLTPASDQQTIQLQRHLFIALTRNPSQIPYYNSLLIIGAAKNIKTPHMNEAIRSTISKYAARTSGQLPPKELALLALKTDQPYLTEPAFRQDPTLLEDPEVREAVTTYIKEKDKELEAQDSFQVMQKTTNKQTMLPAIVFALNQSLASPIPEVQAYLVKLMIKIGHAAVTLAAQIIKSQVPNQKKDDIVTYFQLFEEIAAHNPDASIHIIKIACQQQVRQSGEQEGAVTEFKTILLLLINCLRRIFPSRAPQPKGKIWLEFMTLVALREVIPEKELTEEYNKRKILIESVDVYLSILIYQLKAQSNINLLSRTSFRACEKVDEFSSTAPQLAKVHLTLTFRINQVGRLIYAKGLAKALRVVEAQLPEEVIELRQDIESLITDVFTEGKLPPEDMSAALKTLLEGPTEKTYLALLDLTNPIQRACYEELAQELDLPPLKPEHPSCEAHLDEVIKTHPTSTLEELEVLLVKVSPFTRERVKKLPPRLERTILNIRDALTQVIIEFYVKTREQNPDTLLHILKLCEKYQVPLDKFFAQTCKLKENVTSYEIPVPEPLAEYGIPEENAHKFFCIIVGQGIRASQDKERKAAAATEQGEPPTPTHKHTLKALTTSRVIGIHQEGLVRLLDLLKNPDQLQTQPLTTHNLRKNLEGAHKELQAQYARLTQQQPDEGPFETHFKPWEGDRDLLDECFAKASQAYQAALASLPQSEESITPENASDYQATLQTLITNLKEFMMIIGCCQISHVILDQIGDLTTYNQQDASTATCAQEADQSRGKHLLKRLKDIFLYILSNWNKYIAEQRGIQIYEALSSLLSQGTYCNTGLTMALEPLMAAYQKDNPRPGAASSQLSTFQSDVTLLAATALHELITAATYNTCIHTTLLEYVETLCAYLQAQRHAPGYDIVMAAARSWATHQGKPTEAQWLATVGIQGGVTRLKQVLADGAREVELRKLLNKLKSRHTSADVHYETFIRILLADLFKVRTYVDALVEKDLKEAFTPEQLQRLKRMIQDIFLNIAVSPTQVIAKMFTKTCTQIEDPETHAAPVSYSEVENEMKRKGFSREEWLTDDFKLRPPIALHVATIVFEVQDHTPEQQELLFALIAWSLRHDYPIEETMTQLPEIAAKLLPSPTQSPRLAGTHPAPQEHPKREKKRKERTGTTSDNEEDPGSDNQKDAAAASSGGKRVFPQTEKGKKVFKPTED